MGLKDFFVNRRKKKQAIKHKKVPTTYNGLGHDVDIAQITSRDDRLEELWTQCKGCSEILYRSSLKNKNYVCEKCGYHHRLSAQERIDLIIDADTYKDLNSNILSADPLKFVDLKPYKDRIKAANKSHNSRDAIVTGTGNINGQGVAIASMEFQYIGGSMGSVVGEKITRIVEHAIKKRLPVIIVSSSGGARMHEGILSLMQMAKTSSALEKLHEEKLLYISLLTEPTFGGVTASFSMLGDIIIAEPQARIGFAGRRVIEETIKQKLPKNFQTAEYLVENGQIDYIVERHKLKDNLSEIIRLHNKVAKKNKIQKNKQIKSKELLPV